MGERISLAGLPRKTWRDQLYFRDYGWGWEIGILWRWWLVYCRRDRHLYLSNDATPPYENNRGWYLWRGRPRRAP